MQRRWGVSLRVQSGGKGEGAIFHKRRIWRLGLRDRKFLVPPGGKWKEIDPRVRAAIEAKENWQRLCDEWDSANPTNPVARAEEDDDE